MSDNDFNANPSQNAQNGQTTNGTQGSGSASPQYGNAQYGKQDQNPFYSQTASWQQTAGGTQNPGYSGPSYQQTQPGQTFYQDANSANPGQQPDYQTYGQVPPVGPQGYYPSVPNQKWNTLCIIGFILSFFMPIIGLALSVVALVQINRSGEKSKGMAIAGIVIGAVSTLLSVILSIVLVSAFGYAINHTDSDYQNCHGSDCSSRPYGDDPDDEDNEDTGYAYYLYDFELQTADNAI